MTVRWMKSLFFKRERETARERSSHGSPRDRAPLFKQVEFSLSESSFPRSTLSFPLSLSLSLSLSSSIVNFSIFRRQVGLQQQFSAAFVSLRPETNAIVALFLVTSRPRATGASLCFRIRITDPWKCRNLVASLNSVPSASSARLLLRRGSADSRSTLFDSVLLRSLSATRLD